MPVVLDSSALVDVLIQEKRAAAVRQAVGNAEMVAPDVINCEVLSALRRLERIGELSADRARQAVDDLLGVPLRRFPTLTLLPAVWTLRAGVTPYDACYVVLARALDCPLVTADLRLSRATGLNVSLIIV
jgi:predicted nucleic acid-binding protein